MPTVAERLRAGQVRLAFAGVRTIGAAATEILPFNPNRTSYVIVNDNATAGRTTRGGTIPTATRGVPLDANGGVQSQTFEDVGEAVGGSLRAFLNGGGEVYVEEYEVA